MACRKRLANPLLDGAVINGCVPNIVLVVHDDSTFRQPLPSISQATTHSPSAAATTQTISTSQEAACPYVDSTSCPSSALPITITRDLAHGGYRHSNVAVLVPASPGSMVARRIEDSHEIHRIEPY
jgi:hypothetical protein